MNTSEYAFDICRCAVAEELTAFERQQDCWDMKRERWEDAVRESVGEVDDEILDKYWEMDISADDAADHIAEDMK